ncbi:DNA polymerase [Klebsiella phage phiBO1E]|uniref:DNA polymerase I n=1 Tax=Klebsiella phage phiBO1E TaxID=1555207 RepID=A0A1U8VC22_9CAUD|nr:DNA polymerase [Klebsiella phage phiBO1E]AIT13591.1 DNA polymerase I [Klebsiella phage phiBO1E]
MTTSIMTIDLEVENNPYYGSKASPHCPDNYVVHSAYRIDRTGDDGTVTVEPTFDIRFNSKQEFLDDVAGEHLWFRIPSDCWLIVAHNAAFEISWFLTYQRQHFEEFLKRGGRVFDTMHGEYIVSDFQSMYPSLDETAPKYGGEHKVDGVKILWEQGVLTSQIDPILLRDYLVNGDIPNTALCFYGQCATFAQRNQMQYVWERMDALLAWAYCEWFGLFVNMPIARKNQEEQEQRIREIKQELQQYIPKDLPETLDFNFGSDFHMSALVYGGPIKYRKKVPYDPPQYVKADYWQVGDTWVAVDDMPAPPGATTYKSGKNKGLPKVFRLDTEEEKLKWEDDLYFCPGLVDIQELPEVIREKYAERGEFRQARTLQDGTPVYSTSTDAMEALARQGFEFCRLVNELGALEKDTGTYYLRTEYNEDGSVKKLSGMLQYVIPQSPDGSGIIHHRLNTCSTVTGRLSGSNPNLQNLPRDGTSRVKQMFTSRYGAGGRITEVDYSALEVVMSCVHTGDRKLLSLLQNGTDMHCYRLAFKENKTYEEMYDLCHNADGPDYKYWKQQRTDIKPPSFAAQYGATAKGIAFATGCTVEYAQSFLDNEAKLFPDTIGFRAVIKEEVERTGAAGRMYREQADAGSYRIYRIGTWTSPAGARYSFRQKEQWKEVVPGQRKQKVMDYKETEMANYWCQGEAFFLMAVAAGMVLRTLLARDWFDNQVCLITNVHDALYLDSANPEVGREASLLVKQCMEDAPKRIHQLWPNYGIIGEVPFPAEAEMGTSMYSKEKVE